MRHLPRSWILFFTIATTIVTLRSASAGVCADYFNSDLTPETEVALQENAVTARISEKARLDLESAREFFTGTWLNEGNHDGVPGDFEHETLISPFGELFLRFQKFKRRTDYRDAPLKPIQIELLARHDTAQRSGLPADFNWNLSQFGGDPFERFLVQSYYKKRSVFYSLQEERRQTTVNEADPNKMQAWVDMVLGDLGSIRAKNLNEALKLALQIDEAEFGFRTLSPGTIGYADFRRPGNGSADSFEKKAGIYPKFENGTEPKFSENVEAIPSPLNPFTLGYRKLKQLLLPEGLKEFAPKPKNLARSLAKDLAKGKLWPYLNPRPDYRPSVNPVADLESVEIITLNQKDQPRIDISLASIYRYLKTVRDGLRDDQTRSAAFERLNLHLAFENDLIDEMKFLESLTGSLLKPSIFEENLKQKVIDESKRIDSALSTRASPQIDRLRAISSNDLNPTAENLAWKGKKAEEELKKYASLKEKTKYKFTQLPPVTQSSLIKAAAISVALSLMPLVDYIPKVFYGPGVNGVVNDLNSKMNGAATELLGKSKDEGQSTLKTPDVRKSMHDPNSLIEEPAKPEEGKESESGEKKIGGGGGGGPPKPYVYVRKHTVFDADTIPNHLDFAANIHSMATDRLQFFKYFPAAKDEGINYDPRVKLPHGTMLVFTGNFRDDLVYNKVDENGLFTIPTPRGYILMDLVLRYTGALGKEDYISSKVYVNPNADSYLVKPEIQGKDVLYSYVAYFKKNNDLVDDANLRTRPEFYLTRIDRLLEIVETLQKHGMNELATNLFLTVQNFSAHGQVLRVDDLAHILAGSGLYDFSYVEKGTEFTALTPFTETFSRDAAYAQFKKFLKDGRFQYYCEPSNALLQVILRDYYRDNPNIIVSGVHQLNLGPTEDTYLLRIYDALDEKASKPVGHYQTKLEILGQPGRHIIDGTPVNKLEAPPKFPPPPKREEKKEPKKKGPKDEFYQPFTVERRRPIKPVNDDRPIKEEEPGLEDLDERAARIQKLERSLELLRSIDSFEILTRTGKRNQSPAQIYRLANGLLRFLREEIELEGLQQEVQAQYGHLTPEAISNSDSFKHEIKLILSETMLDWKNMRENYASRMRTPYPWLYDLQLESECRKLLEYIASKDWIE
jgi:hypothetical protein